MKSKQFKKYIKILFAVLGVVLAVWLFLAWQYHIKDVKTIETNTHIMKFQLELDHYMMEKGHYPSTEEGLNALTDYSTMNEGPYLENIPKDAWGNKFIYTSNNREDYKITSYGADGKVGGIGFDADIFSGPLDH